MKSVGMFLLKCAGVWLALMVGQVAGGLLMVAMTSMPAPPAHDGPLDGTQAMVVVSAIFAVVIGLLAQNMRWKGWQKGAAVAGAFYCIATLMSEIEALYFATYLHMSQASVIAITVTDLVRAALVGVVVTFLWREGSDEAPERFSGLWWKIPLLALLYVVVYFGAGALIAWQGAALRAYYQQGAHIDPKPLALLQVFRGAAWAGLALWLARGLTGGAWKRSLLVGLAFSLLMAPALLFPNGFMPWAVRQYHLMEVSSSNFLYGLVAALILLAGRKKVD